MITRYDFYVGDKVVFHNRFCNCERVEGEIVEIKPATTEKRGFNMLNQWRTQVKIKTNGAFGGIERYCLGAFVEHKERFGGLTTNDGVSLIMVKEDFEVAA